MNKKILLALASIALGVGIVFWPSVSTPPVDRSATNPSAPLLNAIANPSNQKTLPDNIQREVDYAGFQDEATSFFEQQKSLSDDERQNKAKLIDAKTDQFQQQGFISASESLMLKLAILKMTLSEKAFEQQGEALVAQYKKDYDVAYEQWRNTPDPKFNDYKAQEADIVKRVMAMDSFPDGLTRDEYLRRELVRARIAVYNQP